MKIGVALVEKYIPDSNAVLLFLSIYIRRLDGYDSIPFAHESIIAQGN